MSNASKSRTNARIVRSRSRTPVRRGVPSQRKSGGASAGNLFRRAVQAVSAPATAVVSASGTALAVARNSKNAAWMGSVVDNQYPGDTGGVGKAPIPVRVLDAVLVKLKNWLGSTALAGITNPFFDWTISNEQLLIGSAIITAGLLAGRRSIPLYFILGAILAVICAPALSTTGYICIAGIIYATLRPMPLGERVVIYAVAGYMLYNALPAPALDDFEKFYAGKANGTAFLPVASAGKELNTGLPNQVDARRSGRSINPSAPGASFVPQSVVAEKLAGEGK